MPPDYRRTLSDDELDRLDRRHRRLFGKAWTKPKPSPEIESALADAADQEQTRRRNDRGKRKRRAA